MTPDKQPKDAPSTTQAPAVSVQAKIGAYSLSVVLLLLFGVNLVAVHRDCSSFRPVRAGQTAPEFEASTLHGDRVQISQLRGRVVVLMFWNIYCGACHRMLPVLDALHRAYERRGLTALAVHEPSGGAGRGQVGALAHKMGLKLTVLLDDGTAGALYKVTQFPLIVVLSRKGVVVKSFFGLTTRTTLERVIREQLAKK